MTAKFEVGKTYYDRAASDWNTVYRFTILARTEKTVTIEVYGQRVRRGISVYEGIEKFKPFGTYSMCAIVSADRPRPKRNRRYEHGRQSTRRGRR